MTRFLQQTADYNRFSRAILITRDKATAAVLEKLRALPQLPALSHPEHPRLLYTLPPTAFPKGAFSGCKCGALTIPGSISGDGSWATNALCPQREDSEEQTS